MLSEFYYIGQQLKKSSIRTVATSSKILGCPKGPPAALVYIDDNGKLAYKVQIVDDKSRYHKYAPDNFNHLFINNIGDAPKTKPNNGKVFKHNLGQSASKFLEDVGEIPEEFSSLRRFCTAITKVNVDEVVFEVVDCLKKHGIEIDDKVKNISVVFDLDKADDLYSEETWSWINEKLLHTDSSCTAKLPFGQSILRSMNPDAKCNRRYGRSGDESFEPMKSIQQSAKDALEWLTHEDRKDKTWKWLVDKAILISYIEDDVLAAEAIGLSGFLADGDLEEEVFIAKSKILIDAIKELSKVDNPKFKAVVIAPAKIRNARIVTEAFFDFKELNRIIDDWIDGCHNIPGQVAIPFPMDCYRVLHKRWKRDGKKLVSIEVENSVSLTDVFDLFFQKMSKPAASRLLTTLVYNWRRFFAEARFKKQRDYMLGCLGVLLHRIGVNKENYMNDVPYKLGRYLSLMDGLHKMYCDLVRKGDYPPAFLGSSFLSSMSLCPLRSFNAIMMRSAVYLKWAKTYNEPDKRALVKWYLREFSELLDDKTVIPATFNKVEQALFFTGYISKLQSKQGERNEE